jgi:integrase
MAVVKVEYCNAPKCGYRKYHKVPDKTFTAQCRKCSKQTALSENWHYRIEVNGKKILKSVSPRKSDAIAEEAEAKRLVRQGKGKFLAQSSKTTWAKAVEMINMEAKVKKNAESTLVFYKNCLRSLTPVFGLKTLQEITPEDVLQFKSDFLEKLALPKTKDADKRTAPERTLSHSYLNRHLAVLSFMLNTAVKYKALEYNHLKKSLTKTKEDEHIRAASEKEIETLFKKIKACGKEWLYFNTGLALFTGLRHGDTNAAKWSDLDLNSGCINVMTKKRKKPVSIPLPGWFLAELKAYRMRQMSNGTISVYIVPAPKRDKDGNMKPLNVCSHSAWDTVRSMAGLKDGDTRLTFHDLRHTFATWFIANGGDQKTLQELLGHSSPVTTAKYIHPSDEVKKKQIAGVHSFMEKAVKGKAAKNG